MTSAPTDTSRPVADRIEVAAPSVAAALARLVGRLPASWRRRALTGAFSRAEAAFNRGDFDAIFALFDDDVSYVPPPVLSETPIRGRDAVLAFWQGISLRFAQNTITNLSLEEAAPTRFVRTARLTHRNEDDVLEYVIRQVTDVRGGRVISQVNETIVPQA